MSGFLWWLLTWNLFLDLLLEHCDTSLWNWAGDVGTAVLWLVTCDSACCEAINRSTYVVWWFIQPETLLCYLLKFDCSWVLFIFTTKEMPEHYIFICVIFLIIFYNERTKEVGSLVVMSVTCLLWISELHTWSNVLSVDPWYVFQIIILRLLLVRENSCGWKYNFIIYIILFLKCVYA